MSQLFVLAAIKGHNLCVEFLIDLYLSQLAVHIVKHCFSISQVTVLPGIKGHNFCVEYLIDLYLSYYRKGESELPVLRNFTFVYLAELKALIHIFATRIFFMYQIK